MMPRAKRRATGRPSGSDAAARSHWATMATLMTRYPIVMVVKSLLAKAVDTPAARISTPAICTKVRSR